MARGNQIARQWAVIKTLDGRPKGISIAEISRDFDSGPRRFNDFSSTSSVLLNEIRVFAYVTINWFWYRALIRSTYLAFADRMV